MFPTHWRWNASIALAVRRFSAGKKTPPQFQRSDAEDLIAVVFPDQIACAENIAGKREIPEHPLIDQTLYDCLNDLMDVRGLEAVLSRIENKEVTLLCRDLVAPSPLAEEVLTAKPYAFLDDAPAEERRTSLVRTRQFLHPEDAAQLNQLDDQVIREVQREAWPAASNRDECHDALMIIGGVTDQEVETHGWVNWLQELAAEKRATQLELELGHYWVCAERLAYWQAVHRVRVMLPDIQPVLILNVASREEGIIELVRMRLQSMGPTTVANLAQILTLTDSEINQALVQLEQEGYAMQGHFLPDDGTSQWCERGLLARIHRRTITHLRKQIEPVSITNFMQFLFHWQGLDADAQSEMNDPEALAVVLEQLEGFEVSAGAWEQSVLPVRLSGYMNYWLDILCSTGRVSWCRLSTRQSGRRESGVSKVIQQSPIAFSSRYGLNHWLTFCNQPEKEIKLSQHAQRLYGYLDASGAQFFDDLVRRGGWIRTEVEQALSELIGNGLVTSDNYAGLRELIKPQSQRRAIRGRRRGNMAPLSESGRWTIVAKPNEDDDQDQWASVEYIAEVLLRRYGIVFRQLLVLENSIPSWRELLYVFRRMEARGEVRGGRFVQGIAGEQFGLPEAMGALRSAGKEVKETLISISAADPLNLTGTILPVDRVSSVSSNRILFKNGNVVATFVGGEINWLETVDKQAQWQAEQKLLQTPKSKIGKYRHQRHASYH